MEHDEIVISDSDEVGKSSDFFSFPTVRRVTFPLFDVVDNPTIQPMTLPAGNIFRWEFKMKEQILEAEDQEILDCLDRIASGNKDP